MWSIYLEAHCVGKERNKVQAEGETRAAFKGKFKGSGCERELVTWTVSG